MTKFKKPSIRADPVKVAYRLLEKQELWKAGKDEWRCLCPFHTKGSKRKAEFRFKRSGYWNCFSCGANGDLVALVMGMEHLDYIRAKEWLQDAPSLFTKLEDVPKLPAYKDRHKQEAAYQILPESSIALYKTQCPVYLLRRGFTEEALLKYEIGYSFHQSRIVIPTRDVNKKLVGITLRLDFDSDGPKYWHDHFDKSAHLYGFHLWERKKTDRLFLVEGQLDVVRMWQHGLAACAILGSSISEEQVALLKEYARCDKLVMMFDNDEAGEKATREAIKALSGTFLGRRLYAAEYPEDDPGELRSTKTIKLVPWWEKL